MDREDQLTPPELEVERKATAAVRENAARLAELYREKFGTEISTDNAREIVSPEYAESREARTIWSRATQKPAGALSDYLFDEALRNPDSETTRPIVTMTAGGTGAGKTTAITQNRWLLAGAFTHDSNLGSRKSSVRKIEAARAAGFQIQVIFVHREPVEALVAGVLPRAMREGRVVDIEAHARMYRDSAENFAWLVRKYSAAPDVFFAAVDNTYLRQGSRPMPLDAAVAIRYSTRVLLPKLRAALEIEYAAGRISNAVYRATRGTPSAGASAGVPGDQGPGFAA